MHVALRRTIKPVAGAPVVWISASMRVHMLRRSATFIPADPWNPRSVFEFATSGCDADREKRHPPAIQVCSFDPIEICILMAEDGLIAGDRYRHKGRRCRL